MVTTIREQVEAFLRESDAEDALFIDDCDGAIIGVANQYTKQPRVAYCYDTLVEIFYERAKESGSEDPWTDAVEWVETNIVAAWHGEGTPFIVRKFEEI